ncbi:phage integrase N-terminal domain-containing protein [Niveibacterium sp.]|uniref:phage integrase N-terminal domain-containing protein n=1 Tax=Niveibacterium sp. TaxID=2017444 RepID=UPI0035B23E9E
MTVQRNSATTEIEGREARGWKRELTVLIATQGYVGSRKRKPISNRTQDKRQDVLFLAFRTLKGLGFRIKHVSDFGDRHVKALMQHWEEAGLAAATLQVRLSILRTLAEWLGKGGMVKGIDNYLKDPSRGRRTVAAQHDHSWSAYGIDAEKLIAEISAFDRRVGMQLKLMHAFALRREEAVMFRPNKADQGTYIVVRDGTKGGRERVVPIELPHQRTVLDEAKRMARGINSHIGHPEHDLKQALRRFNYVVGERFALNRKALGVTSHGLRHQGLNDMFERLSGIPSPVRGQTHEMFVQVDPLKVEYARQRVSEVAGHARLSISTAYLGGRIPSVAIPHLSAEESYAWTRLYELRRKGVERTAEETSELEVLVDRLLKKVADVEG